MWSALVNNFLHGSVNWSQKCSFSLSIFYCLFPSLYDICIKPGAWFPTSACRQLPAAVRGSETLAKAWTSATKDSGISSDCSYKVSPQLDGNSWHLPPCQGKKTVLQNVLICKRKKRKFTGRVWFLQCPSCAKWAERGVFSTSATSWKWKCHIFQHFLSKFSPSLPIIHSALTGTWSLAWPVLGVLLYNVCVSICFPLASSLPTPPFAFQEMVKSTEGKTKLLFLRLPSGET